MREPPGPFVLDDDAAEGWRLVERLVGRGPGSPRTWNRGPWYRTPPSRALEQAIAWLLPAAVLERLFAGGSRARTVLRTVDGRVQAVDGRLWDPDVNAIDGHRFEVAFTSAVDRLWRSAISALGEEVGAVHPGGERGVRDRVRRVARAFAPEHAGAVGDHLAFALFHENIPRLGLDEPVERRAMAKLRSGSALARLFAPAEAGSALSPALVRDPDLLRAVELSMPGLTAAWAASASLLWQADDREQLLTRCRAMNTSKAEWIALIDARGRLDLAEPLVAWFAAVAAAPEDWRARLVRIPGVTTLADRDEVAGIVADTLDPAALQARLDALAGARYGDERFVEARWVGATVADGLSRVREGVRARIGQLRGSLG